MKKFLKILGNIILVLLIIIGVFVGISLLPIKHNYKLFFVTSGSMEPTISTGSVVVSIPRGQYSTGDIITFKNISSHKPQDTTTHRIVRIEKGKNEIGYITKGDANNSEDGGQLSQDQILGKMLFSVPYVGYPIGYVKTLPGLIFIIIIPSTIIIIEEMRKIHREVKDIVSKKREKKTPVVKKTKKARIKNRERGKANVENN